MQLLNNKNEDGGDGGCPTHDLLWKLWVLPVSLTCCHALSMSCPIHVSSVGKTAGLDPLYLDSDTSPHTALPLLP